MTAETIRPASPEDTQRILEIWLSASEKAHAFIPMEYWRSTAPLVEREILPRADTRVFVREGRIEGFLSLLEGDYIGALFVAPENQGQGIGKALLEDRKGECRLLTLAVYRENQGAVGFYRSQGFSVLEERADKATGQQEYLMAWKKE